MSEIEKTKTLYIFIDEGGNLDFSPSGTKYFVLSGISQERPFDIYEDLTNLKYDLLEQGLDIEYFHASEDKQKIRDLVFNIIKKYLTKLRLDSLVVEKRKTGTTLQVDERFYPEMLGYLLKYVVERYDLSIVKQVLIFTDKIPLNSKREAIEKAIKTTLKHKLPSGVAYKTFHHSSKSNFNLQIADYCNWAVYRKWESADERSYQYIKEFLKSEFDIFRSGTTYYY